jgi:hypothetical protein
MKLPDNLECFLKENGLTEKPKHAKIHIEEKKEKYVAWKPDKDNSEPPF